MFINMDRIGYLKLSLEICEFDLYKLHQSQLGLYMLVLNNQEQSLDNHQNLLYLFTQIDKYHSFIQQ